MGLVTGDIFAVDDNRAGVVTVGDVVRGCKLYLQAQSWNCEGFGFKVDLIVLCLDI